MYLESENKKARIWRMPLRTLLLFSLSLLCFGLSRPGCAQSTTSRGGMHLPPLAEQSQGMGVPMKTEDQVNQERLETTRVTARRSQAAPTQRRIAILSRQKRLCDSLARHAQACSQSFRR